MRLQKDRSERIFGLDLLRSLAILIVMAAHTTKYVGSQAQTNIALHYLGTIGVEIFFVLSGFLIAGILIRELNENGRWKWSSMLNFLQRRWFRTLPNYYLALLLMVGVCYYIIGYNYFWDPNGKKYLYFFQNFLQPHPYFYAPAWSLAVEEWSYLILALGIFLVQYIPGVKPIGAFFVMILGIVFLAFFLRYAHFDVVQTNWAANFKKIVIYRLDAVAYGAFAALVNWRFPKAFNSLKWPWAFIGMAGWVYLSAYFFRHNMFRSELSMFEAIAFLALLGVATAFCLPLFAAWKLKASNWFARVFGVIAKLSYSIYLYHAVVTFAVDQKLWKGSPALTRFAWIWILTIGISFLVYYLIERPSTSLRDKVSVWIRRIMKQEADQPS